MDLVAERVDQLQTSLDGEPVAQGALHDLAGLVKVRVRLAAVPFRVLLEDRDLLVGGNEADRDADVVAYHSPGVGVSLEDAEAGRQPHVRVEVGELCPGYLGPGRLHAERSSVRPGGDAEMVG